VTSTRRGHSAKIARHTVAMKGFPGAFYYPPRPGPSDAPRRAAEVFEWGSAHPAQLAAVHESPLVTGFGRRVQDGSTGAKVSGRRSKAARERTPGAGRVNRREGQRPAFESRQGTKARGLGTRFSGRYGDFVGAAGPAGAVAYGQGDGYRLDWCTRGTIWDGDRGSGRWICTRSTSRSRKQAERRRCRRVTSSEGGGKRRCCAVVGSS
jgi:hypothetical protein